LNCPFCSAALLSFTDPCPSCGRRPSVPTEGALAPDPLARLIPSRLEPPREAASRRRREPAWKDEVRQRVNQRRVQRLGGDLPLFPDPEPAATALLDVDGELDLEIRPAAPETPVLNDEAVASGDGPRLVWSMPEEKELPEPRTLALDAGPADVRAPLPTADTWSLGEIVEEPGPTPVSVPAPRAVDWTIDPQASHGRIVPEEESLAGFRSGVEEVVEPVTPIERPAQWNDRLQAALFDLGMLASLWAVVVYFASRAARVSIDGLWTSWPYLVGYLGFLGVVYAVYFTGTTGRTVGKIVCGLKVVDVAGNPPGYARAFARVLLGTLGTAAGMLGLVLIFFDPARRALHDRLLRTRVVKY
jgi:uncharacterized RDD family membrane protein YckC